MCVSVSMFVCKYRCVHQHINLAKVLVGIPCHCHRWDAHYVLNLILCLSAH
jgi:hypothetical protein